MPNSGKPELGGRGRRVAPGEGLRSLSEGGAPSPDLLRKSTSPRWGEVNRMRGLTDSTTNHLALTRHYTELSSACGLSPRRRSRLESRSSPGLAAVNRVSPTKIELAPAKKQSACISS